MRRLASAGAAAGAVALVSLIAAAGGLADGAPSDADTPTTSPSAWNGVWPWVLVGVGVLALLLLLGVLARGRSPRRAPPAAPRAAPAIPTAARARGPRELAALTFPQITGAERVFGRVRERPEPWMLEVAFVEHHRHDRVVMHGIFAGRYLDVDGHDGAAGHALWAQIATDVPVGASALVLFAPAAEVDAMVARIGDAGGRLARRPVSPAAAAALDLSMAEAPLAAPPS